MRLAPVTHDAAATPTMARLFAPEPEGWGLRGDPFVWRALRDHLAHTPLPGSVDEVVDLVHAAFREVTGTDLTTEREPTVYLERYAHGGMSSGHIALDVWRERLIPMLAQRARAALGG